MKPTFHIKRKKQTEQATTGELYHKTKKVCDTLELPWRNNEIGRSCIPAGTYKAIIIYSNRYGPSLWLQNTAPRTEILIHPANFTRQLRGCIAPGKVAKHQGEDVVWHSGDANEKVRDIAEKQNAIFIKISDPDPKAKAQNSEE